MTKKLGLALGGGAMRGFAHLGVLEVLEENQIPVDYIAGTSIGAIIGGIYACGTDLKMLQKIVPTLVFKDYVDVVIPKRGGFLRGDKFQELISIFTKGYCFEQTNIPFCCVAVDLIKGELVELNEGPLIKAIRASMAIPGIFEPVNYDDKLLVDGATISRVPIKTARGMGAEVVVGIDVGYRGGPADRELKRLVDYATMAADILGWVAAEPREKEADLVIAPKVREYDAYSFQHFEECVEAGRAVAEEALPKIRKLMGITTTKRGTKKKASL